ncbi:MAG: hypothetical protein WA020_05095 [Candidatus Acidiferrales bacterium]
MKTRPTNRPELENQKKAYQSPVLVNYGTVWELTRMVGVSGSLDVGGSGGRIKTGT